MTADPHIHNFVFRPLIIGLLKELEKGGKTATLNIAQESPVGRVMKDLGYTPKVLENQDRYKKAGLSGKVYQYGLP